MVVRENGRRSGSVEECPKTLKPTNVLTPIAAHLSLERPMVEEVNLIRQTELRERSTD